MLRPVTIFLLTIMTVTLWAQQSAPAAQNTCDSLSGAITANRKSGHVDALPGLIEQVRDSRSGCPERTILCLGRSVALAYVAKAYDLAEAGKSADEIHAVIDQARKFSSPWALSALEGDLQFDRATSGHKEAYAKAASSYEAALNDLHEPRICAAYDEPADPPAEQIAHIVKRASEAKLLSGTFELARTRDGECGGVFLTRIRDFQPKSTPLPIEFDFDSATFTDKGKQALAALSECVGSEKFASIKLTGHTDMKGDDAYNLSLSARRLDAVKAFLTSSGYKGRIELAPMGKREPFQLDDPGQHSQSEIDQLNRRVELREASK